MQMRVRGVNSYPRSATGEGPFVCIACVDQRQLARFKNEARAAAMLKRRNNEMHYKCRRIDGAGPTDNSLKRLMAAIYCGR